MSGGFDSAIAGHLLKNKLELKAVHYSYEPFTDDAPEKKSRKICEKLGIDLVVVKLKPILEQISEKTDQRYYFLLSKRFMYRIAEKICEKEGIDFIVTGESLSQVSSQTPQNLKVLDESVKIPILRPLIGMNKQQIIDIALEESYFEIAKGPEVCDALGPNHPATGAKLAAVELEEEMIDVDELVEEVLNQDSSW